MIIRSQARKAFTLIEILIVVVILGILAAVVIPQFTNAADDANSSSVRTQLQTLRSQIELYRIENQGSDPNFSGTGWADLINGGYLPAPPKNPITGTSTFGTSAGDGWRFGAFQVDGTNNWASGGTTTVLLANQADGTIYQDWAD